MEKQRKKLKQNVTTAVEGGEEFKWNIVSHFSLFWCTTSPFILQVFICLTSLVFYDPKRHGLASNILLLFLMKMMKIVFIHFPRNINMWERRCYTNRNINWMWHLFLVSCYEQSFLSVNKFKACARRLYVGYLRVVSYLLKRIKQFSSNPFSESHANSYL